MNRLTTTLLTATALIAVAGCAKKRPEVLPPAPAATDNGIPAPVGTSDQSDAVGTTVTPGSKADFERSVSSDTVHFALDHSDIDPTARAVLDSQADWLTSNPSVRVTIEGHTDERGTREYNLALGDRRANAAKNYLAARGISASRMSTISYGKERPLALGSDEQSWAENRRAVTVVPN